MSRILFAPFSIVGSLIAGLVARKAFDRIWARIDDEEPPEAGRGARAPRACTAGRGPPGGGVRAARAPLFDRQARRAFRGLTGIVARAQGQGLKPP